MMIDMIDMMIDMMIDVIIDVKPSEIDGFD